MAGELDIIMYIVLPLIGLIGILTVPWLLPLIYFRWIPKAARTLWKAKRKGWIPVIITHDTGRSALTLIKERRGEGVCITTEGKYKILPRFQPWEEPSESKQTTEESLLTNGGEANGEEEGKKVGLLKKMKAKAQDYRDWIVMRTFLTGLDLPIFYGYSGSLCLLNPHALALVESGEMAVQTSDGWIPKSITDKLDNAGLTDIVQPLLLLDPKRIKEVMNATFDESQIAAVIADVELASQQKYGKVFLIVIMVTVIAVVGILLMLGLPQLQKIFSGQG